MDRMLVVTFDTETKAYEGSKALMALQNEGSLTVYATAVVVRNADGKLAVMQQDDMGPVGTAVGMLAGGLMGMIAGPVGMAIGAYAGTLGGSLIDLEHLGVGSDFLFEAENSLQPGKAAVVAEVWEEWTLPVDNRMEALGGVVIRRARTDVVDQQIEADVETLNADLDEMEAEYKQATGEAKAKIQKNIDATKARLQAKQNEIQARIDANQKEMEAKVKTLEEQSAKENGERKAKRQARIAELKADHQRRNNLLKQARELTKEALAS